MDSRLGVPLNQYLYETVEGVQPDCRKSQAVQHQIKEIIRLTKLRDADVSPPPSHISRLAIELLAEIFLAVPGRDAMRSVFCGVCRAWRLIALSTPRLWTSISLELREWQFDMQMSYLQTIFERSGSLPLSVTLWTFDEAMEIDETSDGSPSPIPTLMPYLSRIQNLSVSLSVVGLQSLSRLPAGSLPLLEHCSIDVSAPERRYDGLRPITVLESARRLRSLSLTDVLGDSLPIFSPTLLRLPPQLVRLSLETSVTPSQLLDLLRQCPNLEHLGRLNFIASSDHSRGAVVLPRLGALDISVEDWFPGDTFFRHLTVPSLKVLEVSFLEGEEWPSGTFNSLLLRSSCPLERLSLGYTSMEPGDFLECLRAVPSLVNLHVSYGDVANHWVLDALTFVPGATTNVLPNLQVFIMASNNADILTYESFANMVESRWWLGEQAVDFSGHARRTSRLSRAHLRFEHSGPQISQDVLQRIGRFREEGLQVSLIVNES
jgi:hypothetical protein